MLHTPARHLNKKNNGFTLVELLVVVCVVATLAALLLGSSPRVKPMAQSAQCLSNLRQLTLGWRMYADDNNGLLAPNDYPYLTAYFTYPTKSNLFNWVAGTMEQAVDAQSIAELTDPVGTALAHYVSNPYVYHCPADNYIDTYSHKVHVRSYSMNSAVGTIWSSSFNGGPKLGSPVQGGWLNGNVFNGSQTNWLTYGNMSSFTRPGPANTFVFMDENPYSINDGDLAVSAEAAPGATYIIDYPSGNHNNGACIAFVDGHANVHAWTDSRTYSPQGIIQPGQGSTASTLQSPDNLDCFYLASATSAAR